MERKTEVQWSQESRAEAKEALASAALDAKANSVIDAEDSDLAANMDVITMAIGALESGTFVSGVFQSEVGSAVHKVTAGWDEISGDDCFIMVVSLVGRCPPGYAQRVARPSAPGSCRRMRCWQIPLTPRRWKRTSRPIMIKLAIHGEVESMMAKIGAGEGTLNELKRQIEVSQESRA